MRLFGHIAAFILIACIKGLNISRFKKWFNALPDRLQPVSHVVDGTTRTGCCVSCSLSEKCYAFGYNKYTLNCIEYRHVNFGGTKPTPREKLDIYVPSHEKGVCDNIGKYFNGFCYTISTSKKQETTAKKICKRSGDLIEEPKKMTLSFLDPHLKDQCTCLWVQRKSSNTKNNLKYDNWTPGQPNGHCIMKNTRKVMKCLRSCCFVCSSRWANKKVPYYELVDCGNHGGKGFRDSCYVLFTKTYKWFEARKRCKEQNMYLAEISNKEENAFIIYYLTHLKALNHWRYCNAWIALNDQKKERVWIWDESGTKMTFSYWLPHNPDGKSSKMQFFKQEEDCVEIGGGNGPLMWNDRRCNDKIMYLCESRWNKSQ